ncbi:MAG TPA: hypothetical protein DHW71_14830 [Gammaproteobacteria bacterium]|nr:hypothetical protein [Gammaproteobacteria bacterium]|tara:strand:- start:23421 stop:25589 length:2169 start_codon:yes stop_codon:yes gene_type:complete
MLNMMMNSPQLDPKGARGQNETSALTRMKTKTMQLSRLAAAVIALTPLMSASVHAEPRIRANNAAYFQDEDLAKAQSHKVDSLAYGEAIYLMHSDQDLKALVRLAQAGLEHQLSVYPTLLQASIASNQGLNQHAMQALDKVATQENTQDDLNRLYLFQAELAYEHKDFDKLAEKIMQVRQPNGLEDPDLYYYLRIQSALERDQVNNATDMMGRMAVSPWKAISHTNIALWYYRQGQFQNGIDTLNRVLEELDTTSTMDAYEYWYTTGRRASTILGQEEFERQKYELQILSERVLNLIGFGYVKLMTEPGVSVGSQVFEDSLESAQNAIFQIPQDSIYATQGLELLAQSLMQVYEGRESKEIKDSMIVNDEKLEARLKDDKAKLKSILTRLTQPTNPVLTRLRSHFALLKLEEDNQDKYQAAQAKLVTVIEKEIAERTAVLNRSDDYFNRLVAPFYSLDQLGNEYGFDLESLTIKDYPLHPSTLIHWLSQPQTREYLKTLRFLNEGLAFTQEWEAKKVLFNLYDDTVLENKRSLAKLEAARSEYAKLEKTYASLKNQLENTHVTSTKEKDMLKSVDSSLETLQNLAAQSPEDASGTQRHINQLRLFKGQLIWKAELEQSTRDEQAKVALSKIKQMMAQVERHIINIENAPAQKPIDREAVLSLDDRISNLDMRVERALSSNKTLFTDSFKNLIGYEQQYLQAALVKLRLQQAVSIQNSGEPNE